MLSAFPKSQNQITFVRLVFVHVLSQTFSPRQTRLRTSLRIFVGTGACKYIVGICHIFPTKFGVFLLIFFGFVRPRANDLTSRLTRTLLNKRVNYCELPVSVVRRKANTIIKRVKEAWCKRTYYQLQISTHDSVQISLTSYVRYT